MNDKKIRLLAQRDRFIRAERDDEDCVEFNGFTVSSASEFAEVAKERGWVLVAVRPDVHS